MSSSAAPATEPKPIHIHGIVTKNFMAVEGAEVALDPNDHLVIIAGDNGQGKTSFLESVWAALGGKPGWPRPIHGDADSAEIELDLGDIMVSRRFWYPNGDKTAKLTSELKVWPKRTDGIGKPQPYRSPQEVLDRLLSSLGFDPFDIVFLKGPEQLVKFKQALRVDTTELDQQYAQAYDERTQVNRELKTKEAKFQGIKHTDGLPAEEISLKALTEELGNAHEHNRLADEAQRKADLAAENLRTGNAMIDSQRDRVKEIRLELEVAEARLADMTAKIPEIEKNAIATQKVAEGMQRIDVDEIEERMEGLEETNRAIRSNIALVAAQKEWDESEKQRLALEETLKGIEKKKRDLVAAAVKSANIEGLTLEEDGPWVINAKGVKIPFSQDNTASKIKIAAKLAMMENPRLRAFRIRDGEKITKTTMPDLLAVAEEFGFQIFIEYAATAEEIAEGRCDASFIMKEGTIAPALKVAS